MVAHHVENKIRRTWNKKFLDFLSLVWCALFLGLIVLRDVYDKDVHYLILAAVFGCAMLFSSYENAVAFFCMIIPMTSGIKGVAIYSVAFMCLFLRRRAPFSPMQLLFPLFFIAYEWVMSRNNPDVEYYHFIALFASFLLFGYFLFDRHEGVDYKKALTAYILGTTFFVGIILVVSLREYSVLDFFRSKVRFGSMDWFPADRDILRDNENNVAYFCLVAAAAFIPLLHSSMKTLHKIVLAFPVLFCVFCGILTVSRAYILVFAVIFAYYVLIHLRFNKRSLFVLCGVLVFVFCVCEIIQRYPFVFERFLDRFNESNVTLDDSRVKIFNMYNTFLFENDFCFFLGTGCLSVEQVTGFRAAMHNGTQQIFVSYGLIGFLLFVFPLIFTFIRANRPKIVRLVYFIPLLAVVGFTQTIQFIKPSVLMMPMILAMFSIKIGQEEGEKTLEVPRDD